jgi:hypothetical protein
MVLVMLNWFHPVIHVPLMSGQQPATNTGSHPAHFTTRISQGNIYSLNQDVQQYVGDLSYSNTTLQILWTYLNFSHLV